MFNVQPRFNFSDEIIWSWSDTSPDLTLGISATGRECARVQIRWCYGWRSVVGSAQVWGPSIIGWSHWGDWGGSSRWWCGQKKGSCVVQYLSEGLRKDWVILNLVSNLESWTLGSSKATAPFQLTTTPEQRRRSQPKKTDALWGRTKRQLPFSWPLPEGDEDGGRRRRQTHSGVEQSGSSLSADRYPRVTKTEADEEDRRTLGSNKAAAPFQLTATRGWRRRKQTKKTDALWGRTKRQLPFSWPLPQGDEDGGRRRRETHSGVTLGSNSDALWVEQNGSSLSADD